MKHIPNLNSEENELIEIDPDKLESYKYQEKSDKDNNALQDAIETKLGNVVRDFET